MIAFFTNIPMQFARHWLQKIVLPAMVLPPAVGRYIDDFQGAPVVCAHMGGMFCTEEEIREIAAMPVYTDTALCVRHMDQKKLIGQQSSLDRSESCLVRICLGLV